MSWLEIIAIVLPLALALGAAGMYLGTWVHTRFLYPRVLAPRFRPGYTPRVAVIVPAKGAGHNLAQVARALLTQDYPDYRILFTLESPEDPARTVLEPLLSLHPQAGLVFAGHAAACCQKNQNQLRALEELRGDPAELLAFADADIVPDPHWLSELVKPLSDPKWDGASGFRFLVPLSGSVSDILFSYINGILVMCMANPLAQGFWGGAMVVRRAAFDRIGAAQVWARTVVDDISLSMAFERHGLRCVYVPLPLARAENHLETVGQLTAWYTRQCIYGRLYLGPAWMFAFFLSAGLSLSTLAAPFLLALAALGRVAWPVALANAAVPVIMTLATLWLRAAGDDRQSVAKWLLWATPGQLLNSWCVLRALLAGHMVWSGIRYDFDRRGTVTRVRRPGAD